MAIKVVDTVYTTSEASDYLGLSRHTVRKYIERGLIKAKKMGSINLVTKKECDRYKNNRRRRGNPNLSKSA